MYDPLCFWYDFSEVGCPGLGGETEAHPRLQPLRALLYHVLKV
jgi:hypothetical protein